MTEQSKHPQAPACVADATSARQRPVWFPQWSDVLETVRLKPLQRQQHRLAIIRYLRFCKETRQQATVASAREFMSAMEAKRLLSKSLLDAGKEALNWFFSEAAKQPAGVRIPPPARRVSRAENIADTPPLAAVDLGKTEWEQRLVRVLRARHYQWRTEQTYRQWAWRFSAWMQQRSTPLEDAGNLDVRDFLTDLAAHWRVSASTQKQALNALVFLLREALERDLGEFGDFARARPSLRIPVVLTRDECQRLFAAMDGTARLMAELMYGSGLRLKIDRAVGFRLSAIS